MTHDSDVDAWFEKRAHPFDDALRLARDLILEADDRVTESIKWNTPTFAYKGNIASFAPAKSMVSIMFHRGSEIPGHHPRLEGDSRLVRNMRFADRESVAAGASDLQEVIRAWCRWRDGS